MLFNLTVSSFKVEADWCIIQFNRLHDGMMDKDKHIKLSQITLAVLMVAAGSSVVLLRRFW